jgi:hypothetical protein
VAAKKSATAARIKLEKTTERIHHIDEGKPLELPRFEREKNFLANL